MQAPPEDTGNEDTGEDTGEVVPVEPAGAYSEAPVLAEMDLPPVEERLPENPLVVVPVDSVGEYGGTWERAFLGVKDFHALGRLIYESVLRWLRDPADPIQPGLAEKWEWSNDGTELTL